MAVQDILGHNKASESKVILPEASWRPIHYLGSKLRMLDHIEAALEDLSPGYSSVCDLFAGSGTVASRLARTKDVTSVDIQEYSRIICSALLNPVPIDQRILQQQLEHTIVESEASGLLWAARPLIDFENWAIDCAEKGELKHLCDLLELGPLAAALLLEGPKLGSKCVHEAVAETRKRINSLNISARNATALLNFGGLYFSFKQSVHIDLCLSLIDLNEKSKSETIIAATLSAASEVVNTVGKQFAQPIRPRNKDGHPKKNLSQLVQRDRYKSIPNEFISSLRAYARNSVDGRKNLVVRNDYLEHVKNNLSDIEIVYADPPYTRDHYSRFYHVLETLALRDSPDISTNKVNGIVAPSRGAYRKERHQSPFCIRSEAPKAFEAMFRTISEKNIPLALSYSPYASEKNAHPRVMSLNAIEEIASRFFREISVRSAGEFSHSRLNRSDLNKEISYEAEFIFLMKP